MAPDRKPVHTFAQPGKAVPPKKRDSSVAALPQNDILMNFKLKMKADQLDIKRGIRRNFARRAGSYDRQACVQRLMAQGLLARLADALPRSGRLLEIGCGTGYFTRLLKQSCNGAALVALDLDAALVAAARERLGAGAGSVLAGGGWRDPEPGPF